MNDKTTDTKMFNEVLKKQRVSFYWALLCLLLLVPSTPVSAQSNDGKIEIPLEKVGDDLISNKEGLPKRDLELEAILPIAMYNASNDNLAFISHHVTFESVTYYIMDASGIIIETDEIILPKNVEITLPLVQLFPGSYIVLLEFDGMYFQGKFVK